MNNLFKRALPKYFFDEAILFAFSEIIKKKEMTDIDINNFIELSFNMFKGHTSQILASLITKYGRDIPEEAFLRHNSLALFVHLIGMLNKKQKQKLLLTFNEESLFMYLYRKKIFSYKKIKDLIISKTIKDYALIFEHWGSFKDHIDLYIQFFKNDKIFREDLINVYEEMLKVSELTHPLIINLFDEVSFFEYIKDLKGDKTLQSLILASIWDEDVILKILAQHPEPNYIEFCTGRFTKYESFDKLIDIFYNNPNAIQDIKKYRSLMISMNLLKVSNN